MIVKSSRRFVRSSCYLAVKDELLRVNLHGVPPEGGVVAVAGVDGVHEGDRVVFTQHVIPPHLRRYPAIIIIIIITIIIIIMVTVIT